MAGNGEEFGPCPFCGNLHAEEVLLCPEAEKLLPFEGRVIDQKFRFVRMLGEGGMGAVWKAENMLVKKDVAIKLMHIQFARDEGVLARFRNEATAAGRIGSEHICDILDLGKSVLGPYIVMEMLQGKDFANFLQEKRGQVDPGLSVLIVREALIGLQAAHDVGIVHRDLKPENIFLHEPKPGRLVVKLMDFGISKFTEGSEAGKTGMGVLMGTPEYMSPEQTEGAAQVDHRTDIWAMGVILYWSVTGRNPFSGPTLAATLVNVATKPPPPLAQAAPHVDPGLAAIIDRCMAKAIDHRWNSCVELAAALLPFEKRDNGIYRPMSEAQGAATRPGGTLASAPSSPPAPGATMASAYTPAPAQHTPGPAAHTPMPGGVTPAPTLGTGPGQSPTWAGGMQPPAAAAPTLGAGGGFALSDRELDVRPGNNIGGGGSGMMIFIVLLLVLGGGGGAYWFFALRGAGDGAAVAVADADGGKAADGQAAGGDGPDAQADETGGAADGDGANAATEGRDVAAADTGAAEGGAADGGAADGGAADGGAADGGAAEGGAAEGGAADGGAADGGGAAEGGAADDGAADGGAADAGAADGGAADSGAADDGAADEGGVTSHNTGHDPPASGPKFDKKKVKKVGSLYALKRMGPRLARRAANARCAQLGKFGGIKKWRLPSVAELKRVRPPAAGSGAIWVSERGQVYDTRRRAVTRAGPKKLANAYCVSKNR